MLTILNLFGRSPFALLESHMGKVASCVYLLRDLFQAVQNRDYQAVEKIAEKACDLEHQADIAKNDIRNHLPKSLFLPIDKGHLLEILAIQDSIADKAEDIAILATLKEITFLTPLENPFQEFLEKNLETFEMTRHIIQELQELLESSFGGIEAEKVRRMVDEVSFKEHESDLLQRKLLKELFKMDEQISYGTFYLWQSIFNSLGEIANLSENLAHRVRTTLELK
ncbi:TIGR00153 family protein [Parachlamydia sp. AcF125]|uniref:TIGR00153 family protein n=1 Tax=Parachlamydia sp. AcF125 TaxID=2795736 RepID=UPI001BC9FD76|nr:TIGR00153 family protein [Parachlamydia sp. AcF125]MBS4168220.1 hypothetical protein [Parachlamydia sp. AcF125]